MKTIFIRILLLWIIAWETIIPFPSIAGDTVKTPHHSRIERERSGLFVTMVSRKRGLFRIKNSTEHPIRLDSLFSTESKEPYSPADYGYQIYREMSWLELRRGYDVFGNEYLLNPNKSVLFSLDLRNFDETPKGTLVRVRVGQYFSKAFTW